MDWAADRRWGDRATHFIKVSLEQRAQGKGRLYKAGFSVQPAASNPDPGLWGEGLCSANSEPGALRLTGREEGLASGSFLEPLPPHLGWALRWWGRTWGLSSVRQGMRLLTEVVLGSSASSHIQMRRGRRKDQSLSKCPTLLFTKLFKLSSVSPWTEPAPGCEAGPWAA